MDNSKSLHRQVAKWWTFERFLLCVLSIALLLSLSQIRTTQTSTHEVRSTSSEGFLRTTATAGLKLQCTVVSAEDAPKSESDIIIHEAPPRSNAAVITPPLVHRAPIVAPPAAPLFPPPPPLLPLPPSPPGAPGTENGMVLRQVDLLLLSLHPPLPQLHPPWSKQLICSSPPHPGHPLQFVPVS